MQDQTRQDLLMAARAAYGEFASVVETDDFGFFFGRDWALKWFMMLERFNILPGAGGWMDQDYRVQHDIERMIVLYSEALDKARPNDGP